MRIKNLIRIPLKSKVFLFGNGEGSHRHGHGKIIFCSIGILKLTSHILIGCTYRRLQVTAKQRKNAKASAKYAPWRNCTCGAGVSFLDVERWHGRTIWKCTRCNRTVYADKSWEVSVAWYIGINGCADGSVTPWNEFAVAFKWNEGAS